MSIGITASPRKLTLFLLVAIACTGLGIFVHGRVLPEPSVDEPQTNITDPQHPAQVAQRDNSAESSEASAIAAQLKQAIEHESRHTAKTSASMEQRIAQTKRAILDVQRIRQQQSGLSGPLNDDAKQQAFAGKIEALKAQLDKLQ